MILGQHLIMRAGLGVQGPTGCWVRGRFRVYGFIAPCVLTPRQDGHKCASLERRSD